MSWNLKITRIENIMRGDKRQIIIICTKKLARWGMVQGSKFMVSGIRCPVSGVWYLVSYV